MLLAITSRTDSYLQFLTVLLLFVFVLVITYFTTRWIARYQKVKSNADNLEVNYFQQVSTDCACWDEICPHRHWQG